jgi:hypothetical protein
MWLGRVCPILYNVPRKGDPFMYIASAISVLEEEYPQPETGKKPRLNVKEKLVQTETASGFPRGNAGSIPGGLLSSQRSG